MCGRYQFDADAPAFGKIVRGLREAGGTFCSGEVFPTDRAPVLLARDGAVRPAAFVWGFPNPHGKGAVINARAETAGMRPMFREALRIRRCAVPTSGFYEWSHDGSPRRKYRFRAAHADSLYLAGLYQYFDGAGHFVVLTTAADASMQDVHDRMPVVLRQAEIRPWLLDNDSVFPILEREHPALTREAQQEDTEICLW